MQTQNTEAILKTKQPSSNVQEDFSFQQLCPTQCMYEPVHTNGYCYNLISGCRTTLEPLEEEEPDTGSTTFFTPDGPSDAGGGERPARFATVENCPD